MNEQIVEAARLLRTAKYAVALTGAGISTPSGIPDFRSHDSGLWDKVDPFQVASIMSFKIHPQKFFDWIRPLARTLIEAEPNAAHHALSYLERHGRLKSVITQNIDMLHTRAGSQRVIEVHGHMRQMTCIRCYRVFDSDPFLWPFVETGEMPLCPVCAGVLKPNVILFGEQLPNREITAARQESRRCDVMLVIGSSLEVAPACDLPVLARQNGAEIILVNLDTTPVDSLARIVIRGDVATVLPQIADTLEAV